jgi:hypothetical protein
MNSVKCFLNENCPLIYTVMSNGAGRPLTYGRSLLSAYNQIVFPISGWNRAISMNKQETD